MLASFARDRLVRSETINPVHPKDPGLVGVFPAFDRESASGVTVDESTAMTFSAVYACVKVLAEDVAKLPLFTFQRLERGKRAATEHPLYEILHLRPNGEMSSAEFREAMQGMLALRGNAIAQIVTRKSGAVDSIWPISAGRVSWSRVGGRIVYLVKLPDGTERRLQADEVLHLRGLSTDGLNGISTIRQARESIGMGIASERFGARLFANGSSPRGVIQLPAGKTMNKEQHDEFVKRWNAAHEGLENQHRAAILQDGMEWHQVGVNPDDAQFLETRKFQVEEVARWYRMPLHKISNLDRATFSNIEQQNIDYVVDTISPWVIKWEQGISLAMLSPAARKAGYFAEFQLQGLLRGDAAARGEFYKTLFNVGAITPNEIRALENMNPADNGDRRYIPLNMVPVDEDRQDESSTRTQAAALIEARAAERETRARRSAEVRRRSADSFRPVFEDIATRIIRSESREVRSAAAKMLDRRDTQSFLLWLDEFYRGHEEWIGRQLTPAFMGLGESIAREAGEEVSAPDPMVGIPEFLALMVAAAAQRHAVSSREQLRAAVLDADDGDALASVETRLEKWGAERASRVARRETVQTAGAVTRKVYKQSGVTRLRWVTFGADCPFCEGLDGRIVGIEENFAGKGEMFEADGREPLRLRTNIGHPPIHLGCDCGISPA